MVVPMQRAAEEKGKSLSAYILLACVNQMERDGFQMQEPEESEEDPQ